MTIPAAARIPVELIVTAVPTIAELKLDTPVTFSVVIVAPTPEMFIPPLNVDNPVLVVLVVSS